MNCSLIPSACTQSVSTHIYLLGELTSNAVLNPVGKSDKDVLLELARKSRPSSGRSQNFTRSEIRVVWLQMEPAVKDAASRVEPATKNVTEGYIRPAGDYVAKNAVPATKALGKCLLPSLWYLHHTDAMYFLLWMLCR
jgi:hypothetical protein